MNEEGARRDLRAEAFHSAFVVSYMAAARQKYARLVGRLPFHGQDVHVIYGGNRWWQILCTSGQRPGDMRFGPVGRYTLQSVNPLTYPLLADLPDQKEPRLEEFRMAMGVGFFIYHEAFAPPGPSSEAEAAEAGAALAERLVEEHAVPLMDIETLKTKVASLRNAHQLLQDLEDAQACFAAERYRAVVATTSAAAESAVVGRLEELGHPIRQEERARVLGHEYHSFAGMVAELYRRGGISSRTRDRLEVLNGLRRGIEHCRPDATARDDAQYAWDTVQQVLADLVR